MELDYHPDQTLINIFRYKTAAIFERKRHSARTKVNFLRKKITTTICREIKELELELEISGTLPGFEQQGCQQVFKLKMNSPIPVAVALLLCFVAVSSTFHYCKKFKIKLIVF